MCLASLVALAGCAGDGSDGADAGDGTGDGGGGGGGGDGGGGGGGGWALEQVSKSAESGTYGGDLAFTASGDLWMAYNEPELGAGSNQDVLSTGRSATGTWSAGESRNPASSYQFSYPSLVASGDDLHLVMSGRTTDGGANDVYYARTTGGAWDEAVALTSGQEGGGLGSYQPVLAAAPDGRLTAAFLFAGDVASAPAEIRVAPLVGGTLAGSVVAIPADGATCSDPALVVDAEGRRHLVGACSGLRYTRDTGGVFAEPSEIPVPEGYGGWPALALDPDGESLHLAWFHRAPCDGGDGTCAEILYATRRGGAWSTPVEASGGTDTFESGPTIAVGDDGTIYIAFFRNDADNDGDIFVATSTDGTSFSETLLTPGTDDTSQVNPRSMIIDPSTGAPHFTFTDVVGGDPFNTEVWHAWLEPGGTE